jgi:hypothetical protein
MDHTGKAGAGGEFAKQATQWMTPNVPNGGRHVPPELVASKGTTADGQKRTVGLESQVKYWPTPKASEMDRGTCEAESKRRSPALLQVASQWPTPAARDSKGTNSEQHATETGGGRKHMDQLANFVAYSPLAQPIRDGLESSNETPSLRRHLNPLFGAWLMGWPSTWVIAEPHASSALETESFHSALQQRLSLLLGDPGSFKEAA